MSRVFVVQEQTVQDRATGVSRPKVDLRPALEYGSLEFIFQQGPVTIMPAAMIETIERKLADFDPEVDYLLAWITSPALFGVVAAYLGHRFGAFSQLEWDRKYNRYNVIEVELHGTSN